VLTLPGRSSDTGLSPEISRVVLDKLEAPEHLLELLEQQGGKLDVAGALMRTVHRHAPINSASASVTTFGRPIAQHKRLEIVFAPSVSRTRRRGDLPKPLEEKFQRIESHIEGFGALAERVRATYARATVTCSQGCDFSKPVTFSDR
jgi:hypothetical protein